MRLSTVCQVMLSIQNFGAVQLMCDGINGWMITSR